VCHFLQSCNILNKFQFHILFTGSSGRSYNDFPVHMRSLSSRTSPHRAYHASGTAEEPYLGGGPTHWIAPPHSLQPPVAHHVQLLGRRHISSSDPFHDSYLHPTIWDQPGPSGFRPEFMNSRSYRAAEFKRLENERHNQSNSNSKKRRSSPATEEGESPRKLPSPKVESRTSGLRRPARPPRPTSAESVTIEPLQLTTTGLPTNMHSNSVLLTTAGGTISSNASEASDSDIDPGDSSCDMYIGGMSLEPRQAADEEPVNFSYFGRSSPRSFPDVHVEGRAAPVVERRSPPRLHHNNDPPMIDCPPEHISAGVKPPPRDTVVMHHPSASHSGGGSGILEPDHPPHNPIRPHPSHSEAAEGIPLSFASSTSAGQEEVVSSSTDDSQGASRAFLPCHRAAHADDDDSDIEVVHVEAGPGYVSSLFCIYNINF
jgi:hypothetical protein